MAWGEYMVLPGNKPLGVIGLYRNDRRREKYGAQGY